MKTIALCAATALMTFAVCSPTHAADVEAGKKVFGKCATCHSTDPGVTRVGPSLFGVVGRKAGTEPGYQYSTAMKDYGVTWEPKTLDTYLVAPMQVVKGTKMTFPGLKDETDRANVIAYLETLKK